MIKEGKRLASISRQYRRAEQQAGPAGLKRGGQLPKAASSGSSMLRPCTALRRSAGRVDNTMLLLM